MNLKNVSELLNDSMKQLNILPETVEVNRVYSIVEFCQEHLKLSENDTIDFCIKYVHKFPAFTVNELVLEEGMWDDVRNKMRNVGKYGVQPKPAAPPNKFNIPAKLGNAFKTDTSFIMNSPMIKVVDPKNMSAKFFVFPDLDLNQPGHMEILQNIMKQQSTEGKTATPVDTGSGDRQMAARSKAITTIGTSGSNNKREDLTKALTQLATTISNAQKTNASTKMAISPQQVAAIKNDIMTNVSELDKISAAPSTAPETTVPEATKQIDSAISAESPSVPAQTETPATNQTNATAPQTQTGPSLPIKQATTSETPQVKLAYEKALEPTNSAPGTAPETQTTQTNPSVSAIPGAKFDVNNGSITGKEGITIGSPDEASKQMANPTSSEELAALTAPKFNNMLGRQATTSGKPTVPSTSTNSTSTEVSPTDFASLTAPTGNQTFNKQPVSGKSIIPDTSTATNTPPPNELAALTAPNFNNTMGAQNATSGRAITPSTNIPATTQSDELANLARKPYQTTLNPEDSATSGNTQAPAVNTTINPNNALPPKVEPSIYRGNFAGPRRKASDIPNPPLQFNVNEPPRIK